MWEECSASEPGVSLMRQESEAVAREATVRIRKAIH
jgi:hypothetical protein